MSKRKRFIITSTLLAFGFISIQLLDNQFRFWSIGILTLLTPILFFWSLSEGLAKDMTLLTLLLPTFFTAGVGIFWFLLPSSILARVPVTVMYGLGIYALCLTMNIYSVAAIRTIALLRAAKGVGFVLTLLTLFLIYDAILSLKISFWANSLLSLVLSFPLFFQGYWSVTLDKKFSKDLVLISAISSLAIAEVALSLFFWPVTVVGGSLFLTIAVYIILGLGQAKLEQRLFAQTVREYLLIGALVFIGMFIATHWGG
ncbi:MAG: hypothetical protein Q8P91_03360 [bacterium]|nr:hypothetical protein [bacterium]